MLQETVVNKLQCMSRIQSGCDSDQSNANQLKCVYNTSPCKFHMSGIIAIISKYVIQLPCYLVFCNILIKILYASNTYNHTKYQDPKLDVAHTSLHDHHPGIVAD